MTDSVRKRLGQITGAFEVVRSGERMVFPTRAQYLEAAKGDGITTEAAVLSNDDLVLLIQADWHRRGQNGCHFARMMNAARSQHRWRSVVLRTPTADSVAAEFGQACSDADCWILSLVMPMLSEATSLRDLMRAMGGHPEWELEVDPATSPDSGFEGVTLSLRALVGDSGKSALPIGFGPFGFLPATRRAPFTEVIMGTEPKWPEVVEQHPELATAPNEVHLADVLVALDHSEMDNMIDLTRQLRAFVLGAAKDPRARAHVTFSLPIDVWDQV